MTKVISLFSGCGGLDLGFKWSGFDIVWAIDNYKEACETYRKNVGKEIICEDIRKINFDEVPDCDIVIGGPPCQAFSLIGKRDSSDQNFMMIWEFFKAIKSKMPHAFVMENVPGLRSAIDANGQNVLQSLIKKFENLGYTVTCSLINAADYGVPQRRKRLVLLGTHGKNGLAPLPKTHTGDIDEIKQKKLPPWISALDAIGDLPDPSGEDIALRYKKERTSNFSYWARENSDSVYNHWMPSMSELDQKIIGFVKEGGNYMDVPNSIPSRRIRNYKKTGGRTTTYGRLDRKMPAYTINTYFSRLNVGCNIHFSKDRLITIREGMRLQSFKDNFILPQEMSKRAQYTVVGNAVPPLLGFMLAETLRNNIVEIRPYRRRVPKSSVPT